MTVPFIARSPVDSDGRPASEADRNGGANFRLHLLGWPAFGLPGAAKSSRSRAERRRADRKQIMEPPVALGAADEVHNDDGRSAERPIRLAQHLKRAGRKGKPVRPVLCGKGVQTLSKKPVSPFVITSLLASLNTDSDSGAGSGSCPLRAGLPSRIRELLRDRLPTLGSCASADMATVPSRPCPRGVRQASPRPRAQSSPCRRGSPRWRQ
jgi:hypothetical protein